MVGWWVMVGGIGVSATLDTPPTTPHCTSCIAKKSIQWITHCVNWYISDSLQNTSTFGFKTLKPK